jgi:hypothetical protein
MCCRFQRTNKRNFQNIGTVCHIKEIIILMKVLCDIQYLLYKSILRLYSTLLLLLLLLHFYFYFYFYFFFLSRNLLVGFVARRPAAAHPVLQRHLLLRWSALVVRSVMSLSSICMECPKTICP